MPLGLYLETAATLERGSTVLLCLPDRIAQVGRSRGYLPAGGCPDGSSPVVKQVLALPGDVVELQEQFLAVNQREVVGSRIQDSDTLGRPLDHAPFGPWPVRDGELWVIGLNRERSWDSRYFGPIPLASVIGSARPLLTFNPGQP
jgi:conjugative transfer signal peptidase TraF